MNLEENINNMMKKGFVKFLIFCFLIFIALKLLFGGV